MNDKIQKHLERIANIIMINSSYTNDLGLFSGKTGIILFLYHYSRYTGNKMYEIQAGDLIDEIYEDIHDAYPINFESGLMGISWGLNYLSVNDFIENEAEDSLEALDQLIWPENIDIDFILKSNEKLFGHGIYFIDKDVKNNNSKYTRHNSKYNFRLELLTDACLYFLKNKSIENVDLHVINSVLYFITEVIIKHKSKILNKELLDLLASSINNSMKNINIKNELDTMLFFIERQIKYTDNIDVKNKLIDIEEDIKSNILDGEPEIRNVFQNFKQGIWPQLLYPMINYQSISSSDFKKVLLKIDKEDYWKLVLDELESTNIGLNGLAGTGLAMIFK